jgi:antitoxin CptB
MSQLLSNQFQDQHRDTRCKRLLFRCWHRGTQESDLILGPFAQRSLAGFDDDQLDRLEALLECSDPDLFDWILGDGAPPPEHDHDVMRLLRAFSAARHHKAQPTRMNKPEHL